MPSYTDHISEVFIKPIRSVLAVDDKFPTLDNLLERDNKHVYDDNSARLSNLLKFCRQKNPEWLVDVHDGRGIGDENSALATMRQCSWLILDYKLDGDSGDGSRSISVMRSLAGSDHFNLIAIYTAEPADVVFRDVVLALSDFSATISPLSENNLEAVDEYLREWEDSEPEIEELLGKEISSSVCFELLSNKSTLLRNARNTQVLAGFQKRVSERAGDKQLDPQLLLNHFVLKHFATINPKGGKIFPLEFSSSTSEKKWIYARNIFISIEGKTTDPAKLFDGLTAALNEWRPSPNQLIVAKIRAELEASGMILDREVVKDKFLQAFWLHRLLDADAREKEHYVEALVDRQSEILGDRLRSKLIEFTLSVVSNLNDNGASSLDITKEYLGIDPSKASSLEAGLIAHNTHVSTKPRSGKNLTSGHVIKIQEENEFSFWVCLSPACDLEAGRTEGRDLKVLLRPWMPTTVLKLHKIGESLALKQATRGWVLFLDVDGIKEQFSYYKEGNDKANPIWEEVFVKDEGRLLSGDKIHIARIRQSTSAVELPSSKHFMSINGTQIPIGKKAPNLPIFEQFDASVIAQLRAEYAASLTLRFTAHLSRIGLDYYGKEGAGG